MIQVEILGPVGIGFVVGIMVFRTMWNTNLDVKSLKAIVGVIGTGSVASLLEHLAGEELPKIGLWYLFGVGLGFAAHLAWAALGTLLSVTGILPWRLLNNCAMCKFSRDNEGTTPLALRTDREVPQATAK